MRPIDTDAPGAVPRPTTAPYGTWASPLTAERVAAGALRLSNVVLDGDDIYWVEGRPSEGGRHVVVRRTADGRIEDAVPADVNVRTRAHEYGGAAYTVSGGTLYYSEFADQRLYRLAPGGVPEALTPAGAWAYADCVIDSVRRRLVCVREDHTVQNHEAITTLISLSLDGRASLDPTAIASGHDFYSTPRISPDGSRMCWLAWNHPQMPWDGTELWLADLTPDGAVERPRLVAGRDDESVFQPGWSPDGELYFVSDRNGWWNLYREHDGRIEVIRAMAADFGRPQWQFGMGTWAFADPRRLVAAYASGGHWHLATIDVATSACSTLRTRIEPADSLAATRTHVVTVGGSVDEPDAVVRIDIATGDVEWLRTSSSTNLPEDVRSAPRAIEFPTDNGLTAHAFYYPPRNARFVAPAGERPPLIVVSHGGPTAATTARLNLGVQYWTSRGFAVVDVNYGGSTGYGRAYRQRLRGAWGIVDVNDCIHAAQYLIALGDVDGRRLIIRGGSAGGYTTLAALAFHPGIFQAGTSYYGVGDLERLALDTHKFESRYLDGLVGPYPACRDLYVQRSPIHAVDRLASPLLIFQGLEDRVVPPNQSEAMADAVRAKGIPVALVTFAGEQHGFRQAANIIRCLGVELHFYGAIFGFVPSDPRPRFVIDNLAAAPPGPA